MCVLCIAPSSLRQCLIPFTHQYFLYSYIHSYAMVSIFWMNSSTKIDYDGNLPYCEHTVTHSRTQSLLRTHIELSLFPFSELSLLLVLFFVCLCEGVLKEARVGTFVRSLFCVHIQRHLFSFFLWIL